MLAIYNEETEEDQTISKIGTGFSEEQLKELADLLRPLTIAEPRPYYRQGPLPHVFMPGSIAKPHSHLCVFCVKHAGLGTSY